MMAQDNREKMAPKRAKGRTFAEFEPLTPAETQVLQACARGERAKIQEERPHERTDHNTIRNDFVRFLCFGGDDHAPVHEHGVDIWGAWIEGDIDLRWSHVEVPLGLIRCTITGKLSLIDSEIVGLNLDSSAVNGIDADRLHCRGSIFLRNEFHSTGSVRFAGAQIGSYLDCTGGLFESVGNSVLVCDGAGFGGSLRLCEGFHARGEVSLSRTRISGNLICERGHFENFGKDALVCERSEISGSAFLRYGFHADGAVLIRGASITGNLECDEATIHNSGGSSLDVSGSKIGGNVFLRDGFVSEGTLWLKSTHIHGDLICSKGRFLGWIGSTPGYALICESAVIDGAFVFQNVGEVFGPVVLTGAKFASLVDDLRSWQKATEIILHDCRYDDLSGDGVPTDAKSRLVWLKKQKWQHLYNEFTPQPWLQLASVLLKMGHEDDAKTIRIKMRDRQRFVRWRCRDSLRLKLWWFLITRFDWAMGLLVGYGYRPWRAVWGVVALWIVGGMVYSHVAQLGLMEPRDPKIAFDASISPECKIDWAGFTGPRLPSSERVAATTNQKEVAKMRAVIDADTQRRRDETIRLGIGSIAEPWATICRREVPLGFPSFQPYLYSLDLLVPLLNLGQKTHWTQRVVNDNGDGSRTGELARVWEWLEVLFGLFLSLLLAGSVSGIIKKE
jgi:hypothetical protein